MFSKLGKKLFLLFFAIAIMAVAILFTTSLKSLTNQGRKLNYDNYSLSTENVKAKILRIKEEIASSLMELQNNSDLAAAIVKKDNKFIQQNLKLLQVASQAIYAEIVITIGRGQSFSARSMETSQSFSLTSLSTAVDKDEPYIQIVEGEGQTYFLATAPIIKKDLTLARVYLLFNFQSTLMNYIRSISNSPYVVFRGTTDRDRTLVFSNLPTEDSNDFFSVFAQTDITNNQKFAIESRRTDFFGMVSEIDSSQEEKYYLAMFGSGRTEADSFKSTILSFFILLLLVLGGTFIIGQLNIYQVVIPLLDITEAIREMAHGENPLNHEVHSQDEIGQLFQVVQKVNNTIKTKRADTLTTQQREQDQEKHLTNALERTSKKYSQVSLLLEISQSTNFLSDTNNVLALILEKISLAFEFHRVSIMLIEAKSNFLELKMVKGYNRDKKIVEDIEVKKQVRLQIGEGIAGLALEKGKLIVADQGFQEATFKKYGSMIDSTVKYLVCAPLIVNNHKIGVINLSHGEHVSPLSEDELEFLNICAHQIAVTIENSRIFDSAITDSMTDLFNYRYFLSRIANEMRRVTRRKTSLSLLYIAIDNYDSLIGLHGTTKIETLVADLSACLRDTLRSTDIAARVKGNEFVALLPETDSAGARITAHKIIKAIADSRFGDQEGMISATVSIGIAVFPTDSQGTTDLIRLAEFALQKAQARGPSSIMGFAPRPPKT